MFTLQFKDECSMDAEIPLGYCRCGCGQKTELARWTSRRDGYVKGQPLEFLYGHHRTRWSNNTALRKQVVEMYKAGDSLETISKKLSVSGGKAREIIAANGVDIRPFKKRRIYSLNESALDEINEGTAYLAGFLMADGAIIRTNTGNCIAVSLSSRDIDHLYTLREILGSTHPIATRTRATFGNKVREFAYYVVPSNRLVDRLADFGVVPRKSLIAEVKLLENNPHFWRGEVDGDGSLYLKNINGNWMITLTLVGSRRLVTQFSEFVHTISPKSKPKPRPSPDSKAWRITITSSHAIRVVKALYGNCTVALARKKAIADQISALPLPLAGEARRNRYKNVYGPDGMAWCSECQKFYPVDQFHNNKSNANGRSTYCKKCVKKKDHERNWRKRHNPAA
jgi:hypothetical protein